MRTIKAMSLILIAVAAGFLALRPRLGVSAAKPAASMILTGTTRAVDGSTLEGATVSARAVNSPITTSVYSVEQGHYYFPPLPAGKYRVWAQAVGYDADRAEATLSATQPTHQDFSLKPTKDFVKQLSTSEYIRALPEDTPADRRMKAIFRTKEQLQAAAANVEK